MGQRSADEPQWLRVSLARRQLLKLCFAQDIYTQAVSGRHWISSAGSDFTIGPGEQVRLPAGLALIDGEGVLQLAPVETDSAKRTNRRSWSFRQAPLALQLTINQGING
ncbi:hypothetical protein J4P02_01235 [Pseudomonas sp. NFXW11]|uniref:hypothetical protein n=1 Tax=Pseudomonas sp. NFXW11 TaxID=2819531 RepID=UPI003CEB4004